MVESSDDDMHGHSSRLTERQFIKYSRQDLLSLYSSPLVPLKLDGMKDLADWYGDYTDPLASPPVRSRDMHSTPGRSHSGNVLASGRANPFTNFGRFGVDGGLEGGEIINTKLGSGDRRVGRDTAPHVGGLDGRGLGARHGRTLHTERERGDHFGRANGEGTSPTKEHNTGFFSNERERAERMKARGEGLAGSGGRDRRDEQSKKDRSRVDEGGWRSVWTSDRDRRLGRGGLASGDSRDNRRERDSVDSKNAGRPSRAPAWMDDEQSSSSSPAWMDAPATGTMSFSSDGHVLEKPSGHAPPGLGGSAGGVDSIQAFKQQMKEMERKERNRREGRSPDQYADAEPASTADTASSALLHSLMDAGSSNNERAAQNSVLESLGIRSRAGVDAATTAGEQDAEAPRGGRGSRFAKFFDVKASPSTQIPAQPQASVFDSLLSGASNIGAGTSSPGPSKEDAESMTRLLGMLQVSSARATSPANSRKDGESVPTQRANSVISPPPQAAAVSPPLPLHDDIPRQTSGGSRFASRFSNKKGDTHSSNEATTHAQSSPALQSQPIPAPTSTNRFSDLPVPQSQDSRDSQIRSHSRTGSVHVGSPPPKPHASSAPPSSPPHHVNNPMSPHQTAPNSEYLIGPQSAASRPLPPLMSGPGGMPISLGPHSQPLPPQMFSGPPPMDLPAHLRGPLPPSGPSQQNGMPGMPLNYHGPPPPFGRPPMPPGSLPPFMMYPPPPPGMFGGPPPPHFRGMPPQPPPPGNMSGIPFGPGGVPDLMALLNSGGGVRNGPPRTQPGSGPTENP